LIKIIYLKKIPTQYNIPSSCGKTTAMDARTKRYLLSLISEQAKSMIQEKLFEQEQPTPDDTPAAAGSAPAAPAPSTTDTSAASDMGSSDGMNTVDQGMTGESEGMSTDSGGGFGGLQGIGGGGGGGGGAADETGEASDPGAEGADTGEDGSDIGVESDPVDPIGSVIELADQLGNATDNVPQIAKALKSMIQVNFSNYSDAWPIVQQLKNSDNESLRAVSRRLALFIAGA
jgi:hypothetical protein